MEMAIAQIIEQNTINGRTVAEYLLSSNLGDLYIVQYENKDMSLEDAYIGWSPDKASKKVKEITKKILNGKI